MINLFKKRNKKEEKEEKASFQRKLKLKELDRQRVDIFSLFDKYAIESDSLKNSFCEMPNAKVRAELLDSQEKININWNADKYESYLKEKNDLVREKFNSSAYLLTYKIEYSNEEENKDKTPVVSVFPFPLYSIKPIIFDEEKMNIEDVLDSMISTFFVIEEENEFMSSLNDFDQIEGFVGHDEEIGTYFKFLRNDLLMLAINPTYQYDSYKSDTGVDFEKEEIDAILTGIDYTQKSIIFVLEQLNKTVEQCKEFEKYIDELNETPADDFEMYLGR